MKRAILYLAEGMLVLSVLALHITVCYLLTGLTGTLIYTGIQAAAGAWIIYEMIRAPAYDE